jgi:hypothetical protein
MKIYIFWDIMQCRPLKKADVSEEHDASIFRAEKKAKQETRMKQIATALYPGR